MDASTDAILARDFGLDEGKAVGFLEENPYEENFLSHVLLGLAKPVKKIDPVYFYDKTGSDLFYRICQCADYYPTRTEAQIFAQYKAAIAAHLPYGGLVVELGGGGSRKIDALLSSGRVGAYVPTDVSRGHLLETAKAIAADYKNLKVACVLGDYMVYDLPQSLKEAYKDRTIFFPGSTLGNLDLSSRRKLFERVASFLGAGYFLLGVDLVKDIKVLERAYNDSEGLTARFNKNLLTRINRELSGDFDLDAFAHRAFFNKEKSRIEMHLESTKNQSVRVSGREFSFARGESIHTESSYKFVLDELIAFAKEFGFEFKKAWQDDRGYFAEILWQGGASS